MSFPTETQHPRLKSGIAPALINLFFTCVFSHAVQDLEEGVYIRYCLDGSLFDLRRLTAKTRTLHKLIHEAQFSPMSVPYCHTKTVIYSQWLTASQRHPDCSDRQSVWARLLHQPAPNSDPVNETLLQTVPGSRMLTCRTLAGKRLQSLRAVNMMIHAVQTNTFRMPTVWKKVNEHWPLENGVSVWGSLLQRARGMKWWGDT